MFLKLFSRLHWKWWQSLQFSRLVTNYQEGSSLGSNAIPEAPPVSPPIRLNPCSHNEWTTISHALNENFQLSPSSQLLSVASFGLSIEWEPSPQSFLRESNWKFLIQFMIRGRRPALTFHIQCILRRSSLMEKESVKKVNFEPSSFSLTSHPNANNLQGAPHLQFSLAEKFPILGRRLLTPCVGPWQSKIFGFCFNTFRGIIICVSPQNYMAPPFSSLFPLNTTESEDMRWNATIERGVPIDSWDKISLPLLDYANVMFQFQAKFSWDYAISVVPHVECVLSGGAASYCRSSTTCMLL